MTATYRPYAEVEQLLDDLRMPRCACPDGCYRIIPAPTPLAPSPLCLSCSDGVHFHGWVGAAPRVRDDCDIADSACPCFDALTTIVRNYLGGAVSMQQLRAAVGLPEAG